jgi:hypothetical protein
MQHACTVAGVAAAAPDLRTLAGWLAGQIGATSLIKASEKCHVEAMRVLIEKGALIEAATKVRIHSHATTHVRSQTLIHTHTHAHTGLRERTI